jgi:hypothetical protein
LSTVYIRFAARGAEAAQRSPLLERLIARASGPIHVADWRADAFPVIAPEGVSTPPIAAVALHAMPEADPGVWACVATPIHLSAGMSSVTMPEDGVLALRPSEADALAADFSRVFGGVEIRLLVGRGDVLLCVFNVMLDVATQDPERVVGQDVFGFQPTGPDGPRLRRLMSEMEMWLFDHEVNRARAAKAQQPISGLWLWGGGRSRVSLPAIQGWTAGQDPFFAAFGEELRFPPGAGSGVVVCAADPGSRSWNEVEQRWLTPTIACLRAGRIARVELSAGERRFSVRGGANLRFWRRPRPWWQSYPMGRKESNGNQ